MSWYVTVKYRVGPHWYVAAADNEHGTRMCAVREATLLLAALCTHVPSTKPDQIDVRIAKRRTT